MERQACTRDGRSVVHWIDADGSTFGARGESAHRRRPFERSSGQYPRTSGRRQSGFPARGFAGARRYASGDARRGYGVSSCGGPRWAGVCGLASGRAGFQFFSGWIGICRSAAGKGEEGCVRIVGVRVSKFHAVGYSQRGLSHRRSDQRAERCGQHIRLGQVDG